MFRRAYRLKPLRSETEDYIARVRVSGAGSENVLLPYAINLGYFVVPALGLDLSIEAGDFCVEKLDVLTSMWVRLRLALLFKKKKNLHFKEFSIFCFGPKPERKRFTTFNQHMFNVGIAQDGDLVVKHPELLEGWTADEDDGKEAPGA